MYLGIDLGTTNVKAVVVEPDGRVVATGTAPVERDCLPEGGVEQDIEQIWQAACLAIGGALRRVDAPRVRALGVSSQGGAMQVLDGDDAPLGRVISWLDTRGQAYDAALTAELGAEFLGQHVGHPASAVGLGQVLRLQREQPGLLRAPHRLGFVGDIIVGRLCGRRVHDPTSLAIAMFHNPWLGCADPEVLARLGLQSEQLPCLLPATTAAGPLDPAVAQLLGLSAGIPVSPAVHDQYTASLGAASVAEGDVNFGAGTAWVLLANTRVLMPPVTADAYVCSHPIAGLYGQMLSMVNGGSSLQWAMQLVGTSNAGSREVEDLLATTSPGANGLRFWPFLSGGPGTAALKGRLVGITLAHRSQDLIRAVVEGLACELLRHVHLLVEAGIPVKRLLMCGGASAGPNTPQILADITNLPVACVETSDVSALGAAMLACVLDQPQTSLERIAQQWTPARRTVEPSASSAAYDCLREDYFSFLRQWIK